MPQSRCVVSVITPLYNTEKYVAECLESVLGQTLRDLEILVVDDGSQDRSVEIVNQIARRDSRVRLLQHPGGVNLGVSRTRRVGIMEASGEYIAYLDADDAFEPFKLERQVDLLRAHPACLLCHTGIQGVPIPVEDQERTRALESEAKGLSDHWNGFRAEISEYSSLDRPDALKVNYICNSSVMAVSMALRSAVIATRQIFQYEDFAQWTMLATKGPFVFTPEPLTRYRVHSQSSTYTVSQEYLRHLYSMVEFLFTLHALTDDSRLRARTESELLFTLSRIRDIYAEGTTGENARSAAESCQPPGESTGYSWESSALELHSELHELKAEVARLEAEVAGYSKRLATIRNSRVYRSLVTVRNFLRSAKPESTR